MVSPSSVNFGKVKVGKTKEAVVTVTEVAIHREDVPTLWQVKQQGPERKLLAGRRQLTIARFPSARISCATISVWGSWVT